MNTKENLAFFTEDDAASVCESLGNATMVKNPGIYFGDVSADAILSEDQNVHQSHIHPTMLEFMSRGCCEEEEVLYCGAYIKSTANKYLCLQINTDPVYMVSDSTEQTTPVTTESISFTSTTDSAECQMEGCLCHQHRYITDGAMSPLSSMSPMSDKRFDYQFVCFFTQKIHT